MVMKTLNEIHKVFSRILKTMSSKWYKAIGVLVPLARGEQTESSIWISVLRLETPNFLYSM